MSFILPHLEYCSPLLLGVGKVQANKIEDDNHYTAISRKVVGKNVHATIPKGNMGYAQYTVPNDCSCQTYFCCFPLALANLCPWPRVSFFQISLENRADKTTHNTFRDCRVHFFRQPFSKQLYTKDSDRAREIIILPRTLKYM